MATKKRNVNKIENSEGKGWLYKGEPLIHSPPGEFGFIYRITNIIDGRIYIGKKQFSFRKKTKLSRKLKRETGKRVGISMKDSGWQNYWSSCKELKIDVEKYGKNNFKREIIRFGKSKSELSYYEAFYQIMEDVMFKPSYNGWISVRVNKSILTKNYDNRRNL